MEKKNNKKLLSLLVFVLLFTNAYSLYSNLKYKHSILLLSRQIEIFTNDKVMGAVETVTRFSHPQITLPQNQSTLVVIFTDKGCTTCYEYEIPNLNNLYRHYSSNIQVYYVGNNSMYLDNASPEFSYLQISPNYPLLDIEFKLTNTTIFLVDKNSLIQQVYRAEIGNRSKSNSFYHRMNSFFGGNTPTD